MIKLSGIIESIATRKDKTIKLSIGTQELTPTEAADIFQLNQQFCYFAIKPEPFTKVEQDLINSLKTEFDNIKSPSQRLRSILFINYEQDSQGYKDFNSYYQYQMEKICEHYKSKLE